jgi:tetratricopeptide (TPR) repeat protein
MYNRIEVFYAYAPEDRTWVQKLEKHLSLLQRQGLITTWHPRLITAGEDWQHVIDIHFQSASLILLLISPDFLASDYCYGREVQQAMERERARGVCIIPILLRPVDWQHTPFSYLSPLPSDASFLSERKNIDRAFTDITIGIRRALENLSMLAANLAQTDFPAIWNVPFPRNPFFLAREDLLTLLHEQLQQGRSAAITQAISGLGGVGKTQLAIEYAYRHHHEYQAVFWAQAEHTEALVSSFTEMASLLNLAVKTSQEQVVIIRAVKAWLQNHRHWLLILDNADELDILEPFWPPRLGGHVILTTRAAAPGRLARRLCVETFSEDQGSLFLLRRAGLIALHDDTTQVRPQDLDMVYQITREVGGLPLALDQIGAYLETTDCGLAAYWQQYQQHRVVLLSEYRGLAADHPQPVATVWSLSFQRIAERSPAAADLLRLCAFLAPDAIQEEMLIQGASTLPSTLAETVADGYQLDRAIETLRAYSFVTRDATAKALTIHRLVQTVLRDSLSVIQHRQWMEHAVKLVNQFFPEIEFATWPQCEACVPHATLAAIWIQQGQINTGVAARLLDSLGYYLADRGRYREAEPFLRRASTMREQILGPEHSDSAISLVHVGEVSHCLGRFAESESLYLRALPFLEQQLGAEHREVANCLYDLGVIFLEQGKHTEAERPLQQAYAIREQLLGPEHPLTAICVNELGRLYEDQGRYAEAATLKVRALAIYEQQSGPGHPQTAYGLHALAVLYRRQGKYAQAEPLEARALAIYEQIHGPEHPAVATSLANLAMIYMMQGNYTEAEPLALRALTIREQQLGAEHPNLAYSLSNLTSIYVKLKKYAQAETVILRALTIREQRSGAEHPTTAYVLGQLADLYIAQGNYPAAELPARRALAIREQQLGPEHPETAMSLQTLGHLYSGQGKYAEVEPLYLRTLAIREQRLGSEHPETAISLQDLADLYVAQERYREAGPLYQRTLAILTQQLGPEHSDTRLAQERYSFFLQESSQPGE